MSLINMIKGQYKRMVLIKCFNPLKMKSIITLLYFLSILSSCKEQKKKVNQNPNQQIVYEEFQIILESSKVSGTILIFDPKKGNYYANDFDEAYKSVIPASTYKIPHSIIGLETGILANEETIFKWDGNERGFSIWEKDLTLKEALHKSCVPCYQEMARKIGAKRMNENLEKLNFGNMDVTAETVDNFWLTGSSKINAFEQIDFLRRLYNKELPISTSTHETIIKILRIEQNEDFILSGKTGLAVNFERNIGWFVGYLEKKGKVFYFATRISPKDKDMPRNEFSSLRKTITLKALKELEILE